MAEQACTRLLDYFVKLVSYRRSFFLGFCVLNFVFSLVATLGNLLVIRALMKNSTIPATVKKLFLSLAFSDLAVGLLPQLMTAIISAVMLKMASSGDDLAFFCPTVLIVLLYFQFLLASASFRNVTVIASRGFAPSAISRAYHTHTCYSGVGVFMVNKLRLCLHNIFHSKRRCNGRCGYFRYRICSDNLGECSYLQSCQISSESDIQSKSASKCPNKGGTPTMEVRL